MNTAGQNMRKKIVIHPFLLAVFPSIHLLSNNINETSLNAAFIPFIASLLVTAMFWVAIGFINKNTIQNGIILSFFIFLFFSSGHIYDFLIKSLELPHATFRFRYILIIFSVISIFVAYITTKLKKDLIITNKILNIIALFLIIIPLAKITLYKLKHPSFNAKNNIQQPEWNNVKLKSLQNLPDIYYILLDGYADSTNLKSILNYDNSGFINNLREMGFVIPRQSIANYSETSLSLSSSLNMNYVQNFIKGIDAQSEDKMPLVNRIRRNKVEELLKSARYKIYNFNSGWVGTENHPLADKNVGHFWETNEFTIAFVNMTPLRLLNKFKVSFLGNKYSIIIRILNNFPSIVPEKGPKFVFAHIISPHPPNVFTKEGKYIEPRVVDWEIWEDKHKYISELQFLNVQLESIINTIIKKSPGPPIIIVQSDHGSAFTLGKAQTGQDNWKNPKVSSVKERAFILNAYYVPENCKSMIKDLMTPVNSFRLIFNCCFNTQYELLENRTYWTRPHLPYEFKEVTDILYGDLSIP